MFLVKLKTLTVALLASGILLFGGRLAVNGTMGFGAQAALTDTPTTTARAGGKDTPKADSRPFQAPTDSPTVAEESDGEKPEGNKNARLPRTSSPAPVQAIVALKSGKLVVRTAAPKSASPVTKIVNGQNFTSYVWKDEVRVNEYDLKDAKVMDTKGQRIDVEQLPKLLDKETLALIAKDGVDLDPLHLRLVKNGTLLFLLPLPDSPPVIALPPGAVIATPPGDAPAGQAPAPPAPPPIPPVPGIVQEGAARHQAKEGKPAAADPGESAKKQESPGPAKKGSAEEKTIRTLIAELGDDAFKNREEAQKRLAAIGLPALDLLRQAAKNGADLESRERAAHLVRQIGQLFFRATLKDKEWGSSVDPDGDCKFRLDAGTFYIKTPGKPFRLSIEQGQTNAPRVMRAVGGDFTAEVEVSGSFPGDLRCLIQGRWPFYSSGLLVWQDEKNYVRLERAFMHFPNQQQWRCYPNWQQFQAGAMHKDLAKYNFPLAVETPTVLRIERKGDVLKGSFSQDRKQWHELPSIEGRFAKKLSVGVAALQNTPAEYEAVFEKLKVVKAVP